MRHIVNMTAVMAMLLALIAFVAGIAAAPIRASAAEAGPCFPISYANIPDCGTFNQPEEGCESDDSYAVQTGSDNCSASYYGFPFSVPSGNVIDGIVVTVEGQVSPGSDEGLNVSLSYDNGTSWTAIHNTGIMTTTDNFYTVGASDDNWGYASWTPAIINSDLFRVRLDVTGTDGTIKIDSTQAKVHYRESTTTTVTTSGSASTYGNTITFTATVTGSGGSASPTGTVDFLNGGVSIGTGTLSDIGGGSARATLSLSTLPAGSHAISAVYGGGTDFAGSTSSAITLAVSKKDITVTADAKSKVYGDPDPALTYQTTSGSLVNGDSFTGTLTRVSGELAGTYDIQQGTLSLSSSYNLTYVGASLTIAARPIVISPTPPTVDGVGPASGRAGETLDVTIQGSELTGATDVDFGPDVTVNSFSVDGLNRITANITIHSDAPPDPCDVTVTTPSGSSTLTDAFRITNKSTVGSGSWWFWLPIVILPILGLLLFFLLMRRRKKETLWDVMARHAYS